MPRNHTDRPGFWRPVGLVLILAAFFGTFISLYGLVSIWRIRQPFITSVQSDLQLLNSSLEATAEGLQIVGDSLEVTTSSLETLEDALGALSKSLQDTAPLIVNLENLTKEDLPSTILTTRASLDVAQSSAKIIDDVLSLVTSIPFFPGDPYAPTVPLHIALQEVSGSLAEMPAALAAMERDLKTSRQNLILIEAQILDLRTNIQDIRSLLANSQSVVDQYDESISQAIERMGVISENLPRWVNTVVWSLTALLVWLALTQIGLLSQGIEILRETQRRLPASGENGAPDVTPEN